MAMMETKEKNMVVQSIAVNNYPIRTVTHQGRDHLVVPVVMMMEGVHNGSRGPLFHSAYELGRVVAAWNGIPITVDHPQDGNSFISANSPDQIDRSVGRVYNSRMDGDKLKAEAWIDIEKTRELSPIALSYIQDQRPLDVSVGVFTDEDEQEGEWNGENYTAVAHNHRPDHLALLPGQQGACSWADGCGVRVNSSQTNKTNANEMKDFKVLKELSKEGMSVIPITNASGFAEVLNKVQSKLDSMDTEMSMYFLEEVFQDNVVYRVRNRQRDTSTLYQQTYSIGDDGKVELTGEPAEVRKEISYQTMKEDGMRRTKFNNNQKSKKMNKKVEKLIANTSCKFTNCDREWLEGLSENQLDEFIDEYTKTPSKEPVLDANSALSFLKENKPDDKDLLQLLSKEAREAYETGVSLYQEKQAQMVKQILDNSDAWTEEELKGMEFGLLSKVAKSVHGAVDYSGQAAGKVPSPQANQEEDDDDFLPRTSA